jgi:CPA1 family monovalent cation:H+ antiporter
LFNFWEYIAFLANSLVFLLIGLQVNIPDLITAWQPVLWAILAVFVARMVVVYGLSAISRRVIEPIPLRWQHVLNWGGLRGAICLALALSLPASLGSDRELLRVMAFGVVLFTLLLQSTTMKPLVRWLHIITRSEAQVEYELRHARMAALRSADTRLDHLHSDGLLSTHIWERLKLYINQNATSLGTAMLDLLMADPALEAEELDTGWRELNRAQRSALLSLRRDGVISEEAYERLTVEVDAQMDEVPTLPDEINVSTQFLEVTIPSDSSAVGKSIAEIGFPREAVFVSIRRGREIIIPRGDTSLQVGDIVTTLCEREFSDTVVEVLASNKVSGHEKS